MSLLPTFLAFGLHQIAAHAEPLILRVKPKTVERREVRTATEDVGLQAARLQGSLTAVNASGKGADCPKAASTTLPDTAVATPESKYADVMLNGRQTKISVVPKSMLPKIYEVMRQVSMDRRGSEIDLKWKNSCLCADRAHVVGDRLARLLNIETGKLMAGIQYGPMSRSIHVILPDKRDVLWDKHVANFVMVDDGPGKPPVQYVLDPALFPNGPVPIQTWRQAMPSLGDNSWTDLAAGKAKLIQTNRFTYDAGDAGSDITSYPNLTGGDSRNLRLTQQRIEANKELAKCLYDVKGLAKRGL